MKITDKPNAYWREGAPFAALKATIESQQNSDIFSPPTLVDTVIIGAGFAGLSAALTLARAGRMVVILEKGDIGAGAASRNGGITSGNLRYSYQELAQKYGKKLAQAIEDESFAARADLYAFIKAENIDCDFTPAGRITGLYQQHDASALQREMDRIYSRHSVEQRYISTSELAEYTHTSIYSAGIYAPDIHGIHPAKLLCEYVRLALAAGVHIHTQTPAQHITRENGLFSIHTAKGKMQAEHVIGASNAYTDKALPWLRRRIVPVISEIITTQRLGENQVKSLMPKLNMFGEARALGYYYRPTPDGQRILLGGRRMHHKDSAAQAALHNGLSTIFPALKSVDISHYWSGFVGFSFDQLPKLAVHDGIIYPTAFAGSGTVWARWLGQKAALMILGEEGVSQFEKLQMRTLPFYSGDPWFLPLAMRYYRIRDRLDRTS